MQATMDILTIYVAMEATVDIILAFLNASVNKGHRSFGKFIFDEGAFMNFSFNIGELARSIQATIVVILAFVHKIARNGHCSFDEFTVDKVAVMNFSVSIGLLASNQGSQTAHQGP